MTTRQPQAGPIEAAINMAVSKGMGSFGGCPYNKSPTIWGLYWGP